MTLPEDPPRLLDEPGDSSGELGLGLGRMSSNLPGPETLARMAARLGVTPTGAPLNGRSTTAKTLAKIAGGTGIAGVVLFLLLRGSSPGPAVTPAGSPSAPALVTSDEHSVPLAPNAPNAPKSRADAPIPPASPPQASPPAEPHDLAMVPPSAPTVQTRETRGATRPGEPLPPRGKAPEPERAATSRASRDGKVTTNDVAPAPATPPVAPPPTETALLRDARLALNGDPARALALTEQHRREYPNGGFSQEREVIAITALSRLGRTSEARSRADRFRSAHPTSPYIDRVNRAVPP